jgi:hypothetical protein
MTNSKSTSDPGRLSFSGIVNSALERHVTHILVGGGIVLLDFWTGPLLMFPILFVIPVALSAWYCSARLAYGLAVLLPIGRFLTSVFIETSTTVTIAAVNGFIRIAVLVLLAFLVARAVRQAREIKILRGLIPICGFCKSIRSQSHTWERLEAYIAEHSEAQFTHGVCPECMEKHYGELFDSSEKA